MVVGGGGGVGVKSLFFGQIKPRNIRFGPQLSLIMGYL